MKWHEWVSEWVGGWMSEGEWESKKEAGKGDDERGKHISYLNLI